MVEINAKRLPTVNQPRGESKHRGSDMRIARKLPVTASLILAMAALLMAAPAHADDDDKDKDNDRHGKRLVVRCPADSVQAAVDRASPGTTIFVKGVCRENIQITKDDITLSGKRARATCNKANPGGSGTIQGAISIESVRARIEFLSVTGPGVGVFITNRADGRLVCNDISENDETGVIVSRSSNAVLRDNHLTNNGQRRFDNPFVFFDCGLIALDTSSVRSDGNTYADNQYCAIEVDRQSFFRNGDFLPREPGNPADPALRDVYIERGCDPQTGVGCFTNDEGPVAIEVFNGGNLDLRNAEVNGEINVSGLSSLRVEADAEIQGNIRNRFNSIVRIRDRSNLGDRGVDFTGTLTCFDNSLTYFSSVQCGQTCSGPAATSCVP